VSSRIRRPASVARSGSSSWAIGAPNNASRPSPSSWMISPPKASTAMAMRATPSPTTALKSSGSMRSPRTVEPTTSAKRAVTTLRASRGAGAVSRGAPHEAQKRAFSATACPHEGQKAIGSQSSSGSAQNEVAGAPVAINVWAAMPVTTILSPHPDDAVLSLWGTLAGPGDVRVINLFTGSPNGRPEPGWWDRMTGADDAASRARERLAEDEHALGLLGRAAMNLGFLDRQYSDRAQPIGSLLEEVTDALPDDALVMAPAALSSHRDHFQAREVALELRRRGMPVTLYADLPHATLYGWPASVTGSGGPAYLDAEVYWETKLAGTGASAGGTTPPGVGQARRGGERQAGRPRTSPATGGRAP